MIALYPGAFKPPHRGHFNVVKSLLDGTYNGTLYNKDDYQDKASSLFKGSNNSKPKIDKVIIFIGGGERNGIDKDEATHIWNIYKKHLGNVEIVDGQKNPMFAAKDYARENTEDEFVAVTGIRGEEDFVDLKRVTTFNNVDNVQGLAFASSPGLGIRATDFRNNILSGNLDTVVDFFPEELSREEILNILNDLKDKIVAEILGSNIDGFISEYFNESQLEENKVVDYVKGLGKEVYANLKAKFNKVITTAKEEGGETLQMFKLLAKQKSGTKLTSQESGLINDQVKDLLKATLTAAGAASAFTAVVSVLPVTATIASLISLINFLDLDDELLKYTDSSKDSSRGLTSIEKDPKNFKYLGKEKYIKYSVVEPYLDQADAVAENLSTNEENRYNDDGYEEGNIKLMGDMILPTDEMVVLQAEEDTYNRGLLVTSNKDKSYDVAYWADDKTKPYPISIEIDGKEVSKDAKIIKFMFHPEMKQNENLRQPLKSVQSSSNRQRLDYLHDYLSRLVPPLSYINHNGDHLVVGYGEVNEYYNSSETENLQLKDYITSLTEYMLDTGMNITPLPELKLRKDEAESGNFFGRTAYYDPNAREIVLYTLGRHDKDVVRSYAHEMVHHMQNLQGTLHNIQTQDTNADSKLLELEKEAYTLGNITFRNWEDSLKNT